MKLDKLVKQLRRDTKANPKKTATLGLMVLVALYFWAPLVWGWIGPSDSSKRQADLTALILTDDPVDPGQQEAASRKAAAFRWDKVRPRMRDDRLMASAPFDPKWRDPFALRQPEPMDATIAIAAPAPEEAGPREAGLALTSVMVGSRRRTATINGKAVREGEQVSVGGQGESPPLTFQVAHIGPSHVELHRGGKRYRLELRPAQLAGGDQILPASK